MRHLRSLFSNLLPSSQKLIPKPYLHLARRSISHKPLPPSPRVEAIVEEIAALTLSEVSELTGALRNHFWIKEVPLMIVVMPGVGYGGVKLVVKGE